MLQVDVLSAYLICGIGAWTGVATMRLAQTADAVQRQALRTNSVCFVVLGIAMMPAGLGAQAADHPLSQWMLTAGTLVAMAILARGIGLLQSRALAWRWVAVFSVISVLACAAALGIDRLLFGQVFTTLAVAGSLMLAWGARGFVKSPRGATERLVGVIVLLIGLSMVVRWICTLLATGPARVDVMYAPTTLASIFAVLYGVLPMALATMLLNLVNARLRQQMQTRAQTDELTGVLTRRALRELAPAMIASEHRDQNEVAVMMLDLDHFKAVNDSFGHSAGDRVLQVVAATLIAHQRTGNLLARYGGEEFVAIVPVNGAATAMHVAERMRQAVDAIDWPALAGLSAGVTVSIGVALIGRGECLDSALGRADAALYDAKHAGRNRCLASVSPA